MLVDHELRTGRARGRIFHAKLAKSYLLPRRDVVVNAELCATDL